MVESVESRYEVVPRPRRMFLKVFKLKCMLLTIYIYICIYKYVALTAEVSRAWVGLKIGGPTKGLVSSWLPLSQPQKEGRTPNLEVYQDSPYKPSQLC